MLDFQINQSDSWSLVRQGSAVCAAMPTKKSKLEPLQEEHSDPARQSQEAAAGGPKKRAARKISSASSDAGKAAPLDIIAIQLKAVREARGLSVSQLHSMTGIARTALHDYEADRYKPGANEIRKLCDALDITPNRLLSGRDIMQRRPTQVEAMMGLDGGFEQALKIGPLLLLLPPEEREAFFRLVLGLATSRHSADKVRETIQQGDIVAALFNLIFAPPGTPDEAFNDAPVVKHLEQQNPAMLGFLRDFVMQARKFRGDRKTREPAPSRGGSLDE